MTVADRSRDAVEALLEELRTEYDDFERIEKTWSHPPARHRSIVERFENDGLGGAGAWITNEDGEVLLVRNEGDEGWSDPGGKVEPGESVEAAAKREVREETGIRWRLTGLREVHVIANRPADGDGPPVYEAIVIFDGEHVAGEPRPRDGEIAAVEWFSAPPERVLYEEVRTRPYPASE